MLGFLNGMTVENFDLLRAKHAIEPWGETRADKRMERAVRMLVSALCGETDVDDQLFDYLGLESELEQTDPQTSEATIRGAIHRPAEI